MHSFLFISSDISKASFEAEEFAKNKSSKLLTFEISSIDQVRELKHFSSLNNGSNGTIIYLPSINKASEAAQNALLKTIEEPNEGTLFVLTADNEDQVLSTIRSRCSIIRLTAKPPTEAQRVFTEYRQMSVGEKFSKFSKINDRVEAITFIKNIISGGSKEIVNDPGIADFLHTAQVVLTRIEGNANVQTQLTYLITKDLSIGS